MTAAGLPAKFIAARLAAVKTVAVFGGGYMGSAFAYLLAAKGVQVHIWDMT